MPTIEELIAVYGIGGEHPRYNLGEWRCEVMNGDTRLGYWEWVAHRVEADEEILRGREVTA